MTIFSDPGFKVKGPAEKPADEHDNELDLELEGLDTEEIKLEDLNLDLDENLEELVDQEIEVEEEPAVEQIDVAAAVETVKPTPQLAAEIPPPQTSPFWSTSQMMAVGQRVLAVFVVMGLIGYGLGSLRGASSVARAEFVYTLDESVPDSFLREDRRLLTQVVTFKSDAVLTPVAQRFDLSVDALRAKIDVETLDLSEVLRLDVTDADEARAIAISRAVLDQYLQVITDAAPAGDSEELAQQRVAVTAQLATADATRQATADATRQALVTAQRQDVTLSIQQQSIERQINLKSEQLNRLQSALDDSLVQRYPAKTISALTAELADAQLQMTDLETQLGDVSEQRAALVGETTTEHALLREIERLESILTTIDDELAQRELGPLVASPIRELSEPVVLFRSRHIVGLQGMALGLMAAIPIAALLAYRTRKRQLWFD